MASSSSSSDSFISPQSNKYDVFISFRGADVRTSFLSHLHEALLRKHVKAFVDENLDRGEDISSSLLTIIEQSYVSLVVFSENYAFSPWCLDELVKIIECRKSMGQIVLPVFYRVNPTDVQELTGCFGVALARQREEFKDSLYRVENWCQALKETAEMSGLVSQNIQSDSILIGKIVTCILEKLDQVFPVETCNDGLVGIDSHVKYVESLLCLDLADVRFVGIWGMGGMGKTTIAAKIFDRISSQFCSLCFVGDVREKLHNCSRPDCLQREVLFQLLGKEVSNVGRPVSLSSSIRKMLSRRKVLIVLDDVSDLKQMEILIGNVTDYGPGSRIIMTGRDKQLFNNVGAEIYEVKGLKDKEALCLFCMHALKHNRLDEEFASLSKKAVRYAQGIPLALKVLGSNLYGKTAEEWEDELGKLEQTSDERMMKILRISYDALSRDEKEIFLDITCFYKGKDRVHVERLLGTHGTKMGISRLADKSLISISFNKIYMHDLLQQMGKDIICEENQIGKRSRLWKPKDIYYVFTKDKGTEAIQGISLDVSKIRDLELRPTAFRRMHNLRLLNFYKSFHSEIEVRFPKGLRYLPDELRFLYWYQFPSKSLPLNFNPENLVELHMPNSQLKELWTGVQNLENLKLLDVHDSLELIRIPDLSRALNLDVLDLSWCRSLVEIPSSATYLNKLTEMYLSYCESLSSLPSFLHLRRLKFLSLCGCSKITELPKLPCFIRELLLHGTALAEVPSSVGHLTQLSQFYLGYSRETNYNADTVRQLNHYVRLPQFSYSTSGSPKSITYGISTIEELPESICRLKYLVKLDISCCVSLHSLPDNLGDLEYLEKLIACGTGIKRLPDSICNLKHLILLDVSNCANLLGLPENLGSSESLEELIAFRTGVKEIPSSMFQLIELRILNLAGCGSLMFPCEMGVFPFPSLCSVSLESCGLLEFPSSLCSVASLELLRLSGNNFESIPESIKQLSYLTLLDISDCMRLEYLPELPISLTELSAANCTSLRVSNRSFQLMEEPLMYLLLDLSNCSNLDENDVDKIMDHLLAIKLPRKTSQGCIRLCIPGGEVPKKIMYRNPNGFNLSFPLRKPEAMNFLGLHLCAVYDPKVYPDCSSIGCKLYFSDDSGHSHDVTCCHWFEGLSPLLYSDMELANMGVRCHSEHFFLWFIPAEMVWESQISYTVQEQNEKSEMFVEFFAEDCHGGRRNDVITECGVHLMFGDGEEQQEEED
ncbi:disease resistance protein (TIR-NBS-LRR class) putative [Euphorbia peplus]|nr:disease resistance protein (TIR-NBS-LRR class) putative [Euphorbia peplus]